MRVRLGSIKKMLSGSEVNMSRIVFASPIKAKQDAKHNIVEVINRTISNRSVYCETLQREVTQIVRKNQCFFFLNLS